VRKYGGTLVYIYWSELPSMAKAHLYIFYSHRYKLAKNGEHKYSPKSQVPTFIFFSTAGNFYFGIISHESKDDLEVQMWQLRLVLNLEKTRSSFA
jgi:hypothetical protein